MARFGRDFVRAATQPAFTQGLFTAAAGLGSAPRRRREERQAASLQKGLFGLEQSALAGELTPEMYKEAVGSYTALMQQNPEQADEIRKSLARVGASVREQDKTQKTISVKRQINNLRNAALAVQRSRGAVTPEEKERTLAAMKQELKRIQEANPNIDLTEFDGMFEDVIVEARTLNKAEDVERRDVKTRALSRQIFQATDLAQLEALTDSLLKSDEENAEAIKKFSNIQQASILDKQERKRQAAEREYDVTTDIKSVEGKLDGNIPEEIAKLVRQNLEAAEKEQKKYRSGDTWTNVAARKKAASLIDAADNLITRYVIEEVALEQRQIAGVESEIADHVAAGVKAPDRNEIKFLEERFAIQDYGREFDKLNTTQKKAVQTKAANEEAARQQSIYDNTLTSLRGQLASLRGEEPPKQEQTEKKTPKITPLKGPEDYDGMVSNALARGNTLQSVRNSLERIGVPAKQIVALADKYGLPLDVDFIDQPEEEEEASRRPSTAVPFVYTRR